VFALAHLVKGALACDVHWGILAIFLWAKLMIAAALLKWSHGPRFLHRAAPSLFRFTPIPVASAGSRFADGRYVYLHPVANLVTANSAAGNPMEPFFSNTNQTNPFCPVGVYRGPVGGYYGARGTDVNTNGLVLWALDTTRGRKVNTTLQALDLSLQQKIMAI
jgi:hypothetical protein